MSLKNWLTRRSGTLFYCFFAMSLYVGYVEPLPGVSHFEGCTRLGTYGPVGPTGFGRNPREYPFGTIHNERTGIVVRFSFFGHSLSLLAASQASKLCTSHQTKKGARTV
jgi:hypothetical protein